MRKIHVTTFKKFVVETILMVFGVDWDWVPLVISNIFNILQINWENISHLLHTFLCYKLNYKLNYCIRLVAIFLSL